MRLRSRVQPFMIIVCAVIWTLLWGQLSIFNLVAGALLGLLIGLVFPMPPIIGSATVHPIGLLRLIAALLVDLVRSSIGVARVVLRRGRRPRNAILGVQLRTRNELYLTQTAELISLTPGSLVVEARPTNCTIYVHMLDVSSAEERAAARTMVHTAEARVIRAFGTRAEIAALRSGDPMPGVDR
ncbi:Na+/H+ antiporter subunit E [Microlunatus soli]|uniref:Multisubunit sodium/proton antiporter, MrpE subunit n=1 Tax=Microlunatus soli TaxID=630515 RepID=A0A1H1Y975_9ACTN|nr:Na+/H+ antiporter subunit E [Microlunatus soli]SDT18010.1 multisubunit sodium/proton antiporter, MrpE subunit [Microlunatus soli]